MFPGEANAQDTKANQRQFHPKPSKSRMKVGKPMTRRKECAALLLRHLGH
jgi:hypothetical protein